MAFDPENDVLVHHIGTVQTIGEKTEIRVAIRAYTPEPHKGEAPKPGTPKIAITRHPEGGDEVRKLGRLTTKEADLLWPLLKQAAEWKP